MLSQSNIHTIAKQPEYTIYRNYVQFMLFNTITIYAAALRLDYVMMNGKSKRKGSILQRFILKN